MNRPGMLRVVGVLACSLTWIASSAMAVPLNRAFSGNPFLDTPLPGTTDAIRPELTGLALVDESQPFSIPSAGVSGTIQSRVVREDVAGTLDFYWRVTVDPNSRTGVDAFRLGSFGYNNLTDADWRADPAGSASPHVARLFNPDPPGSRPDGAINFLFTDPAVPPGAESSFFFLHTDATAYARIAQFDLVSGADISPSYSTFAPVPEPSALLLAGCAGGFLALRRRAAR